MGIPLQVMPIYSLGDLVPDIHPDAFIHPDAVVIGNVTIGAEASVWPGAVLRGDNGSITIGARTSVQDGSVIHAGGRLPTIIGDDCTVGHMVHLEGCTMEPHTLAGSGCVILHRAVVRSYAIVGANAVVPNGMEVPSGALALGVPAKIREGAAKREEIDYAVAHYVDNGQWYRKDMRRIDHG
jgi:carbonic anhydrase/acetyltransferase-like protein (isoleucine patch superfamily)